MRLSETDKRFRDASTECEVDLPRDLRAIADSSQPACDIETLRDAADEIERLRGALTEIAKGEGAFSRDPLTHASNTIDSMKQIASDALSADQPAPERK